MAKRAQETVIIVPNDTSQSASISTANAKWIRRLEKLEGEEHADEIETDVVGAREWELDRHLIRLPFFRKPREWTEEQKEEARERLAGVRAAVAARRAAEAEEEEEDEAPPPRKKKAKKRKAKAAPPPEEEEEEEWEDEEFDDDEEEVEEVVVKKKATKKKARKRRK